MSNGQTVLVVEDDEKISRALKARLVHDGYDVAMAKDAITAVSVAREAQPTIALLDVNMPGGDGFEVAKRIDRVAGDGVVSKVFITASKDPLHRQKAEEAGAVAFIEKPFTAEQLMEALRLAAGSDEAPEVFE